MTSDQSGAVPTRSRPRSPPSTPRSSCTAHWAARPPSRPIPTLYAEVTDAYVTHRARRDDLIALIEGDGREPVAAEPGYELPADLSTAIAVADRALEIERSCAATYAFVVGSTRDGQRKWAVEALLDAAVRDWPSAGSRSVCPGSERSNGPEMRHGPRLPTSGNSRDVPRSSGSRTVHDRGQRPSQAPKSVGLIDRCAQSCNEQRPSPDPAILINLHCTNLQSLRPA